MEPTALPTFRPSEILTEEDLDKLTGPELAEYMLVMAPEVNEFLLPEERFRFHYKDRDELLRYCKSLFNDRGIGYVKRERPIG